MIIKLKLMLSAIFVLCLTNNYCFAHSIPLNKIAVKACDSKQRSFACQYEGAHNDLYIGSCQYMSGALICVRNRPIQELKHKKDSLKEETSVSKQDKSSKTIP